MDVEATHVDSVNTSRPGIAKIERVPPREVWRQEAHYLTTWLAENLDVLEDVVDLDLTNVEPSRQPAITSNRRGTASAEQRTGERSPCRVRRAADVEKGNC
jgi:hypothetical protein